jgi:hypothetical protein
MYSQFQIAQGNWGVKREGKNYKNDPKPEHVKGYTFYSINENMNI